MLSDADHGVQRSVRAAFKLALTTIKNQSPIANTNTEIFARNKIS
jgi:hypothetical protein